MLELAQLYARVLGNPAKARILAKSAHELAPNDAQISETLGRLLYRTGDYQWSMDLLQQAARGLPEDLELQYDLALAEYCVGQVSDAKDTLSALLGAGRPFPRREEAARLATIIAASDSPEQAAASLPEAKQVLAADPTNLPAMEVSALALEEQGKPSDAAAVYEKILAQDPVFSPATRQLALIYVKGTGDNQKAYELAQKAHSAFPEDPSVATALGIANYKRAEYGVAIRLFQESLRRRSDDAETIYYLGMSHYQMKDRPTAKTELKRALDSKLAGAEADEAKSVLAELNR